MKSLKETIHSQRLKTHLLVRSWLQPKMGYIGNRCRVAARVRLANRWAYRHPKMTLVMTVCLLSSILASTIAVDFSKPDETSLEISSGMDRIADVDPVIDGFRTIQANKGLHRNRLSELTLQGRDLRMEMDSLIALPRKSHEDSVRIVNGYKQLEYIVKSLKNSDNR